MIQPVAGMTIALAARYDVMTHDVSSTLVESEPCMCGSATLVTLVSSTCITATTMTEKVSSHFRVGVSSLSPAASAAAVVDAARLSLTSSLR